MQRHKHLILGEEEAELLTWSLGGLTDGHGALLANIKKQSQRVVGPRLIHYVLLHLYCLATCHHITPTQVKTTIYLYLKPSR